MRDEDIGLALMALYRQLRSEANPRIRVALRDQIDDLLDRAHDALPGSYVGVDLKHL